MLNLFLIFPHFVCIKASEQGTCTGLYMSLHIEVLYANVGALANSQAKIIGVNYNYPEASSTTLRYQVMNGINQGLAYGPFSAKVFNFSGSKVKKIITKFSNDICVFSNFKTCQIRNKKQ